MCAGTGTVQSGVGRDGPGRRAAAGAHQGDAAARSGMMRRAATSVWIPPYAVADAVCV